MKMSSFVASLLGVSIAGMSSAWAGGVGGCVDSPENPSLVLALLGGVVAAYPWLRGEMSARLRKSSRSPESHGRDARSNGE
jgi:XrtJ-associated TM-motif-TM protein